MVGLSHCVDVIFAIKYKQKKVYLSTRQKTTFAKFMCEPYVRGCIKRVKKKKIFGNNLDVKLFV